MREIIASIVTLLVDHPEEAQVNEEAGPTTSVITISVAKEDVGKVIGRRGRTASALRTLCQAASGKHNHRYILEIVEP